MITIDEKRTCDICGEKLYKDGPVWVGSEVRMVSRWAGMYSYAFHQEDFIMCIKCSNELLGKMKNKMSVGIGETLSESEQRKMGFVKR